MKSIETISIVGTGNVAFHMGRALLHSGLKICDVYGRDAVKAQEYANSFNCNSVRSIDELQGELIFICVKDDAVSNVCTLIDKQKAVVHTSGTLDMEILKDHENFGVFYPLQTFSLERNPDFTEVPLLVEGNTQEFTIVLQNIAARISKNVNLVNSQKRKTIHLSAVFINNFTNHIVYKAKTLLDKENTDWKILMPLLKETVNKLEQIDPYDAQTGPARRGDDQTIVNHLNMLSGIDKEIYQILTSSIIENYRNTK